MINDEFKKGHSPLTPEDRAVLDFEAQPFKHHGDKEEAIYRTFGYSPTRHYQKVNSLLDHPGALEYSPMLVNRLRNQRSARQDKRSGKKMGLNL